jgi:V/A-type H+-transporting ATPase subunit G/H
MMRYILRKQFVKITTIFCVQGSIMSRAEILSQLKQTEEEAKLRKARAEEEAKQIIANARKEASGIVEAASAKAAADADASIKKASAEIQAEANALKADGEKQAGTLKASARTKVKASADYLMKEFEGYINARTSTHG